MPGAHQGHAEQEWLLRQALEPALGGEPGGAEAELGKAARAAVDEGLGAELLGEPPELAGRGGALLEVDEMGLDAPLGEETEGFAGVGAPAEAEDLDFHGAGIYHVWTCKLAPSHLPHYDNIDALPNSGE